MSLNKGITMIRRDGSDPQGSPPTTGPARGRRRARTLALRVALALGWAASGLAGAAPALLPALNEPASPDHHVGKVILAELVTPDLAASEHFYAGVLGWTFREMQRSGARYAQALADGHAVAGLVQRDVPPGARRQPAWLTFIAVSDVDEARRSAVRNGAKVLLEPRSVPDRGREAIFADPQGAVFAVLASTSGDPPDELAARGAWIWSSLFTADPDTGAAFYQTLFDYEVFDVPESGRDQHVVLATQEQARASVNSLPASEVSTHAHWLNYVRVDDAQATAAKAVSLGGRVLVAPRLDRHGGKVAVVADPQGAPFGLLEWPDVAAAGEVAK